MKRHFLRGPSLYPLGASTNTGDGVRMAMQLGADLRNMNELWGITVYTAEADAGRPHGIGPSLSAQIEMQAAGSIVVNRHGERFMNESSDYDSSWRSYFGWENYGALEYRNLPAFVIYDARVRREKTIAGRAAGVSLPAWVHEAASPGELASQLGIDRSGFERQLAAFNAAAREGRDPLFHRGESYYDRRGAADASAALAPVEEPPFYGAQIGAGDLGTCGGPRVNRNAQVLTAFGEPIERLYASGNNAGVGSPGSSYGGGGGTIGPALTFAFLAGEHAAGLGAWS
jgi:succinate dehydrogenase/fumarate reductase flavoprotein subunit